MMGHLNSCPPGLRQRRLGYQVASLRNHTDEAGEFIKSEKSVFFVLFMGFHAEMEDETPQ
jgi:hypothetical protein